MMLMLAQSAAETLTTVGQGGVAVVATAALALVGYVYKVTLPKLVADFRDEIRIERANSQAERESHARNVATLTAAFTLEAQRQREQFDRASDRQISWLTTIAKMPLASPVPNAHQS